MNTLMLGALPFEGSVLINKNNVTLTAEVANVMYVSTRPGITPIMIEPAYTTHLILHDPVIELTSVSSGVKHLICLSEINFIKNVRNKGTIVNAAVYGEFAAEEPFTYLLQNISEGALVG